MRVTIPVPNFLITLLLKKLEIIVPPVTRIEITPAYDIGTPKSPCIAGHAEPNTESGKPRLIKDI